MPAAGAPPCRRRRSRANAASARTSAGRRPDQPAGRDPAAVVRRGAPAARAAAVPGDLDRREGVHGVDVAVLDLVAPGAGAREHDLRAVHARLAGRLGGEAALGRRSGSARRRDAVDRRAAVREHGQVDVPGLAGVDPSGPELSPTVAKPPACADGAATSRTASGTSSSRRRTTAPPRVGWFDPPRVHRARRAGSRQPRMRLRLMRWSYVTPFGSSGAAKMASWPAKRSRPWRQRTLQTTVSRAVFRHVREKPLRCLKRDLKTWARIGLTCGFAALTLSAGFGFGVGLGLGRGAAAPADRTGRRARRAAPRGARARAGRGRAADARGSQRRRSGTTP